jgi:hypothetical protein
MDHSAMLIIVKNGSEMANTRSRGSRGGFPKTPPEITPAPKNVAPPRIKLDANAVQSASRMMPLTG